MSPTGEYRPDTWIFATCLLWGATVTGCRAESGRSAMAQVPDATGAMARAAAGGEAGAGAASTGMRRLWTGRDFNFYASSPSPDGRYVTEIDWTTGDLAVRDLATGEIHRLTDKGSWEESDELAEISIFSPDGRQVAYVWYNQEIRDYELRVLDFAVGADGIPRGSDPRVVFSSAELHPYWLFGWSEEGEVLATVYRPDETNALALISVEDGSVEIVKSFDWREPRAVLSPDGRFAAYDFPADESAARDIHLIMLDDGGEMDLVDGPSNDRVLAWLADDGGVLFHSDRSGTPSVWRVPLSDGRPGAPVLVREDVRRPRPLGVAGDALYFGVLVEWPRRYSVDVDLEGGRMLGALTPEDDPYDRAVGDWGWSHDGRYAIHTVTGSERAGLWLVLRSEDGGFRRDFGFDLRKMGSLRWAPDGEAVYVAAVDAQARAGLQRIDLQSGDFETMRRLGRAPLGMGGDFDIGPDGNEVFLRVRSPDAPERGPGMYRGWIVAQDVESGEDREVVAVDWRGPQAVSPDGSMLAYVDYDHFRVAPRLLVVPVDGGSPRELFSMDAGDIGTPHWTPDGRTLLFRVGLPSDSQVLPGGHRLWTVGVDGGEPRRLEAFDDLNPIGVRLHPGGDRISFRTGTRLGELWALDGISEATSAASDRAEHDR